MTIYKAEFDEIRYNTSSGLLTSMQISGAILKTAIDFFGEDGKKLLEDKEFAVSRIMKNVEFGFCVRLQNAVGFIQNKEIRKKLRKELKETEVLIKDTDKEVTDDLIKERIMNSLTERTNKKKEEQKKIRRIGNYIRERNMFYYDITIVKNAFLLISVEEKNKEIIENALLKMSSYGMGADKSVGASRLVFKDPSNILSEFNKEYLTKKEKFFINLSDYIPEENSEFIFSRIEKYNSFLSEKGDQKIRSGISFLYYPSGGIFSDIPSNGKIIKLDSEEKIFNGRTIKLYLKADLDSLFKIDPEVRS
ncbi:MAG: hypothetical protein QXD51_01350 [Candidatus Anstonellales archaeon]